MGIQTSRNGKIHEENPGQQGGDAATLCGRGADYIHATDAPVSCATCLKIRAARRPASEKIAEVQSGWTAQQPKTVLAATYKAGDRLHFRPAPERAPFGTVIGEGEIVVTEVIDHGSATQWSPRFTYVVRALDGGTQGTDDRELTEVVAPEPDLETTTTKVIDGGPVTVPYDRRYTVQASRDGGPWADELNGQRYSKIGDAKDRLDGVVPLVGPSVSLRILGSDGTVTPVIVGTREPQLKIGIGGYPARPERVRLHHKVKSTRVSRARWQG